MADTISFAVLPKPFLTSLATTMPSGVFAVMQAKFFRVGVQDQESLIGALWLILTAENDTGSWEATFFIITAAIGWRTVVM